MIYRPQCAARRAACRARGVFSGSQPYTFTRPTDANASRPRVPPLAVASARAREPETGGTADRRASCPTAGLSSAQPVRPRGTRHEGESQAGPVGRARQPYRPPDNQTNRPTAPKTGGVFAKRLKILQKIGPGDFRALSFAGALAEGEGGREGAPLAQKGALLPLCGCADAQRLVRIAMGI